MTQQQHTSSEREQAAQTEPQTLPDRQTGEDQRARPPLLAAVQCLVDRERARMAFHPATWWDLAAVFAIRHDTPSSGFPARLTSLSGRPLAATGDFNPATGQPTSDQPVLLDETAAVGLRNRLELATFRLAANATDGPLRIEAVLDDGTTAVFTASETSLEPTVEVAVDCRLLEAATHTTQPPKRHTVASLLDALGPGITSSTAVDTSSPQTAVSATLTTLVQRGLCLPEGPALIPTWLAFAVCKSPEDLTPLSIESVLPTPADNASPLPADATHVPTARIPLTGGVCVRVGSGTVAFLEDTDGRQAPLPPVDELAPDELTPALCNELLWQASQGSEPLGTCPQTGLPVYAKDGRYGPYVQLGDPEEGGHRPKTASLLPGMTLETLDLVTALGLLDLPRRVGCHPESGKEITALIGRYGPYITCDGVSRSLPEGLSPLDVTLEQAVEVLNQPVIESKRPTHGPLKTLGTSPVTSEPVVIKDGRFGPYITDGFTNASVPKGKTPDDVTLDEALALLAAKADAPRRGGRRRRLMRKAFPGSL